MKISNEKLDAVANILIESGVPTDLAKKYAPEIAEAIINYYHGITEKSNTSSMVREVINQRLRSLNY